MKGRNRIQEINTKYNNSKKKKSYNLQRIDIFTLILGSLTAFGVDSQS